MEIIIKDARLVDVDLVLSLLARQFAAEQGNEFSPGDQARGVRLMLDGCGKHRAVKVAWMDDAIVGMCTAQAQISMVQGRIDAVVNDLIVDHAFRKKGVAAFLLSAIEAWALNKGIKFISLLAKEDDQDRLDFYNRREWKRSPLICLAKSLD
ncbi:MAG: GNAT family N-acetyltransferase [Desulfobacterales bacterium]|nr:GNAT family N-acetyltransferase [Desulfobacterales bacterium]